MVLLDKANLYALAYRADQFEKSNFEYLVYSYMIDQVLEARSCKTYCHTAKR